MFTSSKFSYLVLRLGLAVVFLWFGIDKIFHPVYWLNAWVPDSIESLILRFNIGLTEFVYLNGIFEMLVGLSLITGIFIRALSILAIIFLINVVIFVGISEVTIRDVAIIGGFISVVLWPNARGRF
ncbi:MAG: DoxX family membrane protein [Patescibacteria group bacterium]